MKTMYLIAALAVAAGVFFALKADDRGNSQSYTPARFVILAGDVNVACTEDSGGLPENIQKCVIKMDTRTGQTWILQLAVSGTGDPSVKSAVWAPADASGQFRPRGSGI